MSLSLNLCGEPGCQRMTIGGTCPDHRAVAPVAPASVAVEPAKPRRIVAPGPKNTMGGETPRRADDAYRTDDRLARAILRKLWDDSPVGVPQVFIEPSAGQGAFVRAARAVWGNVPHVIAVEKNRAENFMLLDDAGADEVRYQRWEDANDVVPRRGYEDTILIAGNCPYNTGPKLPGGMTTAEHHVALSLQRLGHATERAPVPRFVAFLLRQSFLSTRERVSRLFLATGGLRAVWHLVERPSFTEDGATDASEYSVLLFQAGFRGKFEGSWLSWEHEA